MNNTQSHNPMDHILDSSPRPSRSPKEPGMANLRAVQFSPLPVDGWHDKCGLLEFKCKQSCVGDCGCVRYCAFL